MESIKDKEEIIVSFGAFEYDAEKMANILDMDVEYVRAELSDNDSIFNKLLRKGKDMADYVIDQKLFEMAKSGDTKALQKLEDRIRIRKLELEKPQHRR